MSMNIVAPIGKTLFINYNSVKFSVGLGMKNTKFWGWRCPNDHQLYS